MGLKVLFVSSEVSPYAKSGGLGDVAGSLPKALLAEGVDVRVVFPKYRSIDQRYLANSRYISSFEVTLDWRTQVADIFHLEAEVPTYMIGNDFYFGRDAFYGYGDENERFAFFSKAAIEFLDKIDFIPDVIHCNDWQSAPICVYLKDRYSKLLYFSKIKSVLTIHNLQYQGAFDKESLNMMELGYGYFAGDKLEFYDKINYLKGGIVYADAITTVSNTYAYEIQTPQYGYNLDGVLRSRNNALTGIVNGIDYEQSNPETSQKIYANYSADNMAGKKENKRRLQEQMGLPVRDEVPVFGLITRLAEQKGINLILQVLNELLEKDVQLVLLGTGENSYENMFRGFADRFPDKLRANITFDDTLAQRIYAGSDFFLMPSLFEPCGLGQLFAMSYGTVPIVRTTGGLVDTVQHFNPENGSGNGFAFHDYISSGLMWAINEALRNYADKENHERVVRNAISTRFSWENSAKEYIKVYERIVFGNS